MAQTPDALNVRSRRETFVGRGTGASTVTKHDARWCTTTTTELKWEAPPPSLQLTPARPRTRIYINNSELQPTHKLKVTFNHADTTKVDKALWEIPHANLLRDAATGAPGLLEFGRDVTERLMGSSRSEGSLLGTSSKAKYETPMIRAFRVKLQQVCNVRVSGTARRWELCGAV